MEQCKVFTQGASDEFNELEKKVNDWLAANPGIKIVKRKMAMCTGVNVLEQPFINCTIAIFYLPA